MQSDTNRDWPAVFALYEQAEHLSDAALTRFLADLPDSQRRLVPLVVALLKANEAAAAGDFLDDVPALLLPPEIPVMQSWASGDRIGPYRLTSRLGAGGMAEVWLAERADDAFDRTVALKLLFRHPSPERQDAFAQRFARERDIVASLDHPNVAGLHDAGVAPDGQPWLAFEFVKGDSITHWCDAKQLTVHQRVTLFRQVLVAVAYAHANLVIHRDLKPSNILVSEAGEVRLLDFGIAKLMEPAQNEAVETELTMNVGRPLTPQYASPEQLRGKPLSTASDVYSLGVVLYELLTGSLPYVVQKLTAGVLDTSGIDGQIKPPSRQSFTDSICRLRSTDAAELRRVLRLDLDAIVLKAMEVESPRRYESVGAMREDLDRWLEHQPVLATIPSTSYRIRKFVRRNPKVVLASTLASLLIAALMGAVTYSAKKAHDDSLRAAKVKDFLLEMFSLSDPNQSAGTDIKAEAVVTAGLERAERMLGDEPQLQAQVLESIGNINQNTGRYAEAEPIFEKAANLYLKVGNRAGWAKMKLVLVDNELQMGDLQTAQRQLQSATADLNRMSDDLESQVTRHQLTGLILRLQGKSEEAKNELMLTVNLARKAFSNNDQRLLEPLGSLALIELGLNNFGAARKLNEESIAVVRREAKPKATDLTALQLQAAYIEQMAGEYLRAEEIAVPAIELCDRTLGRYAENCASIRGVVVKALLRQEEYEACMVFMPDLLHEAENDSSPRRRDSAAVLAADVLIRLHKLDDHPSIRSRLEEIANQPLDKVNLDPVVTPRESTLAFLALEEGRIDRFERALGPVPASPATPLGKTEKRFTVLTKGLALQALGRDAEALLFLTAAHEESERTLGADHSLSLLYGLNKLTSLIRLQQSAQADEIVKRTLPLLKPRMRPGARLIRDLESLAANDIPTRASAEIPILLR